MKITLFVVTLKVVRVDGFLPLLRAYMMVYVNGGKKLTFSVYGRSFFNYRRIKWQN